METVAGAAFAAAAGATAVGRASAVAGVEEAVFLGVTRSPEYTAAAAAAPAKIKPTNHRRPVPGLFPTTEMVRVATGACEIVVGISVRLPYLRECSVRSSPAMCSTLATDDTYMMIEVSAGIHGVPEDRRTNRDPGTKLVG